MLDRVGAEITTRDKHGLQTVIPLGTILSDPQGKLESILGADIIKELRVLFTDQHGADLRNSIAHGLMPHGAFFGFAAIYAWWFMLFLCINPVYRRFRAKPEQPKEEAPNPPESEPGSAIEAEALPANT